MTTHMFLQKFNLGVSVSTCITHKMLFTTVWRLWILFIWSWILILIIILFLHVLQDRWNCLPEMIKCQSCEGFVHEKSGGCKINLTRGNPVSFKCPTCSELETGFYNVALVWELIVAVVTLKYCSCWLWFTLTFHIGHIHTVFYTGMLSLSLTFWQQVVPEVSSGSFWGCSWTQQRSRSWWRLWEHCGWWRWRRATWLW